MDIPDWQAAAANTLWRPYRQMKNAPPSLPVVGASGVRMTLADGHELIDGIASWWTACHGHRHPHITAALADQLNHVHHVMLGGLVHPQAARLSTRLAALCPGDLDHVFFSESGSVSVEIALKMAIQYWRNKGVQGRTRFLAFHGGYHGDTMAAMSVCDPEEGMHTMFRGALAEQVIAPIPAHDKTAKRCCACSRNTTVSWLASLWSPWCRGPAACAFTRRTTSRGCAGSPRTGSCC